MTDKARIKIATIVTALFLAAVSAAGVIAHRGTLPTATAITSSAALSAHAQGQGHLHPIPISGGQEHD